MSNRTAIDKILRDVGDRVPRFRLGQRVRGAARGRRGHAGVIDSIYANLNSAIASFIVSEGWYEQLHPPPNPTQSGRRPQDGFWYGVVLEEGAVLLGEDDIEDDIDGTSQ